MSDAESTSDQDDIYRSLAADPGAPVRESGFDEVIAGTPAVSYGEPGGQQPGSGGQSGAAATAGAAKDGAQQVAGNAAEQASDLAGSAKEKAADVAGTAKSEGRKLVSQAQQELQEQARQQQQRVASGLGSTADELRRMAENSETGGLAADVVRQAGERTERVATWLENCEPGELLADVRSFASSRPAVFIAGAAIAGILAGRLARGLKDGDA